MAEPVKLELTRNDAFERGDNPDGEWRWGYCRMCMRGDCALKYRLKNDVLMEVKGNYHSLTNQGALCPRGQSHIQHTYNEHRIKNPIKRTNPKKGLNEDPGWVDISWEEALQLVADKFTEAQEYDPRSLLINVGFGTMDFFTSMMPFMPMAFGTPNLIQSNGPLCTVHYATSLTQGAFPTPAADYTLCDYHISIGRSSGGNNAYANGDARSVQEAIERGMKMIVVDPRGSVEAAQGEWVPIKPGGDLPFVLALLNVVLYENRHWDIDFLTNRTNGVYLIRPDGSYARSAAGRPVVLGSDGGIYEFDDPAAGTPVLQGEVVAPDGELLRTSFSLIHEAMVDYTPEWASELSTVPAAKIREIANDFVKYAQIGATIEINGTVMPLRPVSIIGSRGALNHQDGTVADLACKILMALVGALDVPGGCLGCVAGPLLKPDEDGTVTPVHEAVGEPFSYPPEHVDLVEYFPHRHSMPFLAYKVAADPRAYGLPYDVRAALMIGANPVVGTTDQEEIAAGLSSIPFVATIGYNYDEVVALSDVVLPESSQLERMVVNIYESSFSGFGKDTLGLKQVMFRDPMPLVHDAKQSQDIVIEILDRMGKLPALLAAFNQIGVMLGEITMAPLADADKFDVTQRYSYAEILDRGLKAYTDGKGIEWFQRHGLFIKRLPLDQCYNYSYFPGNQTRHPIYFERLRASGESLGRNMAAHNVEIPGYDWRKALDFYDPIPRWRQTQLSEQPEGYDLLAMNYKIPTANLRCGGIDQFPWLMKINYDLDPYTNTVCINPATARRKGLVEGQEVLVESAWGQLTARLVVSQLYHPDVIAVGGALGRLVGTLGQKAADQTNFNRLMTGALDTIDPIAGGTENSMWVRVTPVNK
ncbi:MAG: molybdopterin-dependent oxidoreductase [Brooklawnia sp.]|jgi:anaerobic selenocysteine-containing dehydrogenase